MTPIKTQDIIAMPMLATRGIVMFPNVTMHFDISKKKSILALTSAMEGERKIFLVAQNDITVENPTADDLFGVGVVANIKQLLKTGESSVRVLLEGEYRANFMGILSDDPFVTAGITKTKPITTPKTITKSMQALIRTVKAIYESYCNFLTRIPRELVMQILATDDPNMLFELIVSNTMIAFEDKQYLLELPSTVKRLEVLAELIDGETDIISLEKDIYEKVRNRMDKNQHEYYLREQIKTIQQELGESSDHQDDADMFLDEIYGITNIDIVSREKLVDECDRLSRMPIGSQEANIIRTYLETCISLPWDTVTTDSNNIERSQKQLERDHYGLQKVKERILELLSVRILSPNIKGQIICLVGPPGVGKTSIGRSIAKALNRKYVRLSLGGVRDEADIRGHRKTYLGAMPGRIINALKLAGSKNPLILLDEIDKMSNDFRGDPSAAMLEVLDSEQNFAFRDHYLEIPFDLSDALFITTANTTETIPRPLLDRMEIIEISSYTRDEKFNIAKRHLVKKQINKNGMNAKNIAFKDDALYEIIDSYVREAGVRQLERAIGSVSRKVARKIVSGETQKHTINALIVEELLGTKIYTKNDDYSLESKIGVVSGLAWTSVGGEMLDIEVCVLDGTGKLKLTGSLGDVMKESAEIAVSYVRSIADNYNIDKEFYKNKDLHLHAPEGAVPKDGPSAGVTMVTAIVSALTKRAVRGDIAMTGEISLLGRVMKIGGLKEKSMAAHREGKKIVLIPFDNRSDLKDIDKTVLDEVQFIPVKHINDVLEIALIPVANKLEVISESSENEHILYKL